MEKNSTLEYLIFQNENAFLYGILKLFLLLTINTWE